MEDLEGVWLDLKDVSKTLEVIEEDEITHVVDLTDGFGHVRCRLARTEELSQGMLAVAFNLLVGPQIAHQNLELRLGILHEDAGMSVLQ